MPLNQRVVNLANHLHADERCIFPEAFQRAAIDAPRFVRVEDTYIGALADCNMSCVEAQYACGFRGDLGQCPC